MPTPFETQALTGTGSCGCHQQVLGMLPSGVAPDTFSDFENDDYQIGGVSKTFAQVWEADTENAGPFNPLTDLVAGVGLRCTHTAEDFGNTTIWPVSTALVPEVAGGATLVGEVVVTTAANATGRVGVQFVDFPDFAAEWNCFAVQATDGSDETIHQGTVNGTATDSPVGAMLKFAATLAPDRLSISVNGGAVATRSAPSNSTANRVLLSLRAEHNATVVLKNLGRYPTQLDADLPTLSTP